MVEWSYLPSVSVRLKEAGEAIANIYWNWTNTHYCVQTEAYIDRFLYLTAGAAIPSSYTNLLRLRESFSGFIHLQRKESYLEVLAGF